MINSPAPTRAIEAHTALRDACFDVAVAVGREHIDDFPGLLEFVEDKVLFVVGQPARKAFGWIAFECWRNGRDYATEIYINADARQLDPDEFAVGILTTVIHELAHAVNHISGVQGTSRQGRWHNRRFAEVALALGADVKPDPTIGHVTPGPRAGVTALYASEITAIEEALVLAWAPNPRNHRLKPAKPSASPTEDAEGDSAGSASKGSTSMGGKYVWASCRCDLGGGRSRLLRIARGSWIEQIHCPACDSFFIANDTENVAIVDDVHVRDGVSDIAVSTSDVRGRAR